MKYPYSDASESALLSCDQRLQRVFWAAADYWDIKILEGYRTPEKQKELVAAKASRTLRSKHNLSPSRAVDAAPYPIDWDDIERFYQFGWGIVGLASSMGIKLRWGGDWDSDGDTKDQKFNDLVHFEVVE